MEGSTLVSSDTSKEELFYRTFFTGEHLDAMSFDEDHYEEVCSNLQTKLEAQQDNEELKK